ncbi:hypothetical protein CERSUDRAFT_110107 [Gelatoporia subvermispora B]|uniref:Uncharacterized protein n=1 Tax=Ceriporiopsis subvermispora (strain B) TaxID=914234 RepID=M2RAV3_CERS8|nr:hypothetical protein CERSUDRAFT_110107 [Gelatoporia subvermispora B]
MTVLALSHKARSYFKLYSVLSISTDQKFPALSVRPFVALLVLHGLPKGCWCLARSLQLTYSSAYLVTCTPRLYLLLPSQIWVSSQIM